MYHCKGSSLVICAILALALLSSCQMTFVPVTPTPVPGAPTATPPPPTATSLPPTATLAPPTETPLPPTSTHTPPPVAGIQVFIASPVEIQPGDPVTLTWQATGEWATLYRLDEAGRLTEPSYAVALSGSTVITTTAAEGRQQAFMLFAGVGDVVEQATVSVAMACDVGWLFPDPPDACPRSTWLATMAAERFQHGQMLWLEGSGQEHPDNQILVLYDDDQSSPRWQVVVDDWVEGMPEEDPTIVAPEGLYEPVRGFGKVWRENDSVRDRLGWAVEEEYLLGVGVMQCSAVAKYSTCYVSVPDGVIYVLEPEGSAWSIWSEPHTR